MDARLTPHPPYGHLLPQGEKGPSKLVLTFCFLWILLIAFMLQGCMNTAMTGAQVVYGRHNIQKSLHDQYVTLSAYRAMDKEREEFKGSHISVSTFNNIVLITGQAPKPQQREEIGNIVNKIPDIKEVYNLVTISQPSANLIRLSDAWITTKIKTQLIAINEIDPSQIKVITENGTVYLMGIVPPEQADIAVDVAKATAGVQDVVKVFYYIRISKT